MKLELIRELFIYDRHISAASGLIIKGSELYVVCDDEQGLMVFTLEASAPGTMVTLFAGELPTDPLNRKKQKKDLESLFIFEGLIFAVPSGSTPSRQEGAIISLETLETTSLSFQGLFEECSKVFEELNIEGSIVLNDSIILFQRGNGLKNQNALVILDRHEFLKSALGGSISKECLRVTVPVSLGNLDGQPLSFTDAATEGERIFFLAVCEAGSSTYDDGPVSGSVVGEIDLRGKVLNLEPLELTGKPEGLFIEASRAYFVTDDDSPLKPARLLTSKLPF